jgi:acetyl esterase
MPHVRRTTLLLITALCTANGRELRDVEFARPHGVPLTLDGNIPDADKRQPAVILVHGGGWEAGDKQTYIRPWFKTLNDAKIAWFSINYRVAPEWKHPAAVEDVEAAVKWVKSNAKRFNVDDRRLALMGESAGGHLAALAALRGRVSVAALISFYGIHDLAAWFEQRGEVPKNIGQYLTGTDKPALDRASPIWHLNPKAPPMLLVHGTADKGVPYAQSQQFCDAAVKMKVKCELLLIEGAPHGVENWETEPAFQAWKPRVPEWLRQVLR